MTPEQAEEKIIEAEWGSQENETYIMPDGKRVTIGNNAVDIFHKLQNLPTTYKLALLKVDDVEVLEYFNLIYDNKAQELKSILNQKLIWRETGERYCFDDLDCNLEILGVELTKKQLLGKLKRKTITSQGIIQIITAFNNNNELTEV